MSTFLFSEYAEGISNSRFYCFMSGQGLPSANERSWSANQQGKTLFWWEDPLPQVDPKQFDFAGWAGLSPDNPRPTRTWWTSVGTFKGKFERNQFLFLDSEFLDESHRRRRCWNGQQNRWQRHPHGESSGANAFPIDKGNAPKRNIHYYSYLIKVSSFQKFFAHNMKSLEIGLEKVAQATWKHSVGEKGLKDVKWLGHSRGIWQLEQATPSNTSSFELLCLLEDMARVMVDFGTFIGNKKTDLWAQRAKEAEEARKSYWDENEKKYGNLVDVSQKTEYFQLFRFSGKNRPWTSFPHSSDPRSPQPKLSGAHSTCQESWEWSGNYNTFFNIIVNVPSFTATLDCSSLRNMEPQCRQTTFCWNLSSATLPCRVRLRKPLTVSTPDWRTVWLLLSPRTTVARNHSTAASTKIWKRLVPRDHSTELSFCRSWPNSPRLISFVFFILPQKIIFELPTFVHYIS